MNKSLLIRLYNNRLSLFDMLGKSVFISNLWLNPQCGKQPRSDISLMMCNLLFMIFQPTIGMGVLVFMSGYLSLSLLLYNRCRVVFKPLLLLGSAVIPYSGLLTLLNFLFPRCDFLLLPFFFDINLYGPTFLGFWLVVEQPWLKSLCLADRYSNQLG